jgi:POT family proton-dependent oligopeptide transporter
MPLGIMLIGTCFIALYVGCTFFARPDAMISGLWMVLAIFLYSAGELLTSALGVAMITRIAPQRMYGIMMGAWYLIGVALAADLSGELAGLASVPEQLQANQQATLVIYSKAFLIMGLFGIAASVLGLIIGPWLKRAAKI